MNKKGVLLKDIPCTLNQILKCLSVNTDNNDIIYRWIELLKKYNYVTETDGIYVCKIEIYEKGLKYGWEEVEYLWKGKLESPLVLDYIMIIPGLSEPPVRTLRATIPGNESQLKFLILDD